MSGWMVLEEMSLWSRKWLQRVTACIPFAAVGLHWRIKRKICFCFLLASVRICSKTHGIANRFDIGSANLFFGGVCVCVCVCVCVWIYAYVRERESVSVCVCVSQPRLFFSLEYSQTASGREFSLYCVENEDKELQNIEWFTEYCRILNGFTEYYRILNGLRNITEYWMVLRNITEYWMVLWNITEYWMQNIKWFYGILQNIEWFTEYYRILNGFMEYYRILNGLRNITEYWMVFMEYYRILNVLKKMFPCFSAGNLPEIV